RVVVVADAIAVELGPLGEQRLHVVEHVGPRRVASELGPLPWRELPEDGLLEAGGLGVELDDRGRQIDPVLLLELAELLDPTTQLHDGALEVQHDVHVWPPMGRCLYRGSRGDALQARGATNLTFRTTLSWTRSSALPG